MAGADAPGQLLLGEAKGGPVLDHQSGQPLELGQPALLGPIGGAALRASATVLGDGRSYWADLGHNTTPRDSGSLSILVRDGTRRDGPSGGIVSGRSRWSRSLCVHP